MFIFLGDIEENKVFFFIETVYKLNFIETTDIVGWKARQNCDYWERVSGMCTCQICQLHRVDDVPAQRRWEWDDQETSLDDELSANTADDIHATTTYTHTITQITAL